MRLSYVVSVILILLVVAIGIFYPEATGQVVSNLPSDDLFKPLRTYDDYSTIIAELRAIPEDELSLTHQQFIDKIEAKAKDISSFTETDLMRIETVAEELGIDIQKILPDYDEEGRMPYIITFKDEPLSMRTVGVSSLEQRSDLLDFHEQAKRDILSSGSMLMSVDDRDYRSFMVVLNGAATRLTDKEYRRVLGLPYVEKINRDSKVNVMLSESTSQIGADQAWKMNDSAGNNLTGKGITICVIDTGIDYTHSDLGGCSTNDFLSGSCEKVIVGYDFVNNDSNPMDDQGHGTHCASIAAGNGVLKGVAPDATLIAYKVLNFQGSGDTSTVIAAIERATDPNSDLDTSDHFDIISMSLGGSGDPDDELSTAVDNAVAAGVIVVVAAGNDGPSYITVGSPGCARGALTVGASCKRSEYGTVGCEIPVADFSSRGPSYGNNKPDIVAPGVNICAAQWGDAWSESECIDSDHTAISGTSMATPHVAGACALLKQLNPGLTPKQVKSALKMTADDLGLGTVVQGYGEINITKALALDNIPPVAQINTLSNLVEIS